MTHFHYTIIAAKKIHIITIFKENLKKIKDAISQIYVWLLRFVSFFANVLHSKYTVSVGTWKESL